MDVSHTFVIAGAALQLVGIVAVGSPDIVPYRDRISQALGVAGRRVVDRVRLLLRRPRGQVIEVSGIGSASAVGGASLIVSVKADATMEERVEYLLRRDQEAQKKLNEHDGRLRAIEEQVPEQLDELRAETREHVSTSITAAERRYRPLKFAGAIALVVGLGLTTAATFL